MYSKLFLWVKQSFMMSDFLTEISCQCSKTLTFWLLDLGLGMLSWRTVWHFSWVTWNTPGLFVSCCLILVLNAMSLQFQIYSLILKSSHLLPRKLPLLCLLLFPSFTVFRQGLTMLPSTPTFRITVYPTTRGSVVLTKCCIPMHFIQDLCWGDCIFHL